MKEGNNKQTNSEQDYLALQTKSRETLQTFSTKAGKINF